MTFHNMYSSVYILALSTLRNTTPQEFGNGGFALKTHQIFSAHNAPEEFENATLTTVMIYFSIYGRGDLGNTLVPEVSLMFLFS